ncbi:MAG TPA: hypothetical protein PKC58_17090 [Ignavibacteria bacterium]|nr:hypothetical protein [Ignavibacteria bacterium]
MLNNNFKNDVEVKSLNKNPPIQLGLEYGMAANIFGDSFFLSGLFGYVNVNIKNREVFLRIEYGNLWINNELKGNSAVYAAISANAQIFQINKMNKIYIDFGYGLYSSDNYIGGGIKMAVSYIYSINNFTSIIASVKAPVIRKTGNNQFSINPFITLGVQIF